MPRAFLTLLLLSLSLPAVALDWEYVGMDGIQATRVVVDPLRSRVFVGTYEGFHYFDQPTGAWTERDWEGWIGRQVYAIDYADALPLRVITGRENAFFKGYLEYSNDLGATETWVYESTGGSVTDALHLDGGPHFACTWSDIAPGELLRSTNAGVSWTPLAGHGFYAMTDLERGPAGELYLAGNVGVKWSQTGGTSWSSLTGNLPAGQLVHSVAYVRPGGDTPPPTSLLACLDPGLYYSDAPGLWTRVLVSACRRAAGLPVPGGPWPAPDRFAVVTANGRVLISRDFGASWQDETGALPGTAIDLAYSPWDDGLYVLTASRGLYRFQDVVTAAGEAPAVNASLAAYPNPFNPATTLILRLPAAGQARLRVFGADGRAVATLIDRELPAGQTRLAWQPQGLASGVYLARLETPSASATRRLVLLK
ncbi:T9SS type A sorting domain-containing protein [bacterium]|nr:T9SS type A sorting domain-containing protein [bacterium]